MERFAYDLSNGLEQEVALHKITWGGSNRWLPIVLPIFFVQAFFYLLTHLKTDIIHMQDAVQAPIGWLLRVIFRKPYIVVAHGLDITYDKALYQRLILPFVRRADVVICISTATMEEAKKRGIADDRLHVITLGTHDDYDGKVEHDKAQLSRTIGRDVSNNILLLTTGRLVKRKGVEWFIRNVLPELSEKYPSLLYAVAGDGEERDSIEHSIEESNMQNFALMLGRVDDEVRTALYQNADIFVMPNIIVPGDMEGFGIVAHEAATAELPVIASNLEGIADALQDGKNGVLVETKDAETFIKELHRLIDSPKGRREFGINARKYTLDHYGWKNIIMQYKNVYIALKGGFNE